jgi:hypothetical protein
VPPGALSSRQTELKCGREKGNGKKNWEEKNKEDSSSFLKERGSTSFFFLPCASTDASPSIFVGYCGFSQ